jgi:hypothetical protein
VKTIVLTGATDGIGRALAVARLGAGDRVIIVGRTRAKGESFLAAAAALGASGRATFIQADLSLVKENDRVIKEIEESCAALDALVLCARFYRSARTVTAEGNEDNLALLYLSRYVLSHGLLPLLERAADPLIVNVAGPGTDLSIVRWDDLGLEHGYHGAAALMQGGKLNDLLGAAFVLRHPRARTRYVVYGPGTTSTSFAGEYDQATAAQISAMKKFGQPLSEAIKPLGALIDQPPAEPLTASVQGHPVSVHGRAFSPEAAARLDVITRELVPGAGRAGEVEGRSGEF